MGGWGAFFLFCTEFSLLFYPALVYLFIFSCVFSREVSPPVAHLLTLYSQSKQSDLQQRCLESLQLAREGPAAMAAVLPVDASCEDVEVSEVTDDNHVLLEKGERQVGRERLKHALMYSFSRVFLLTSCF